jgi:HEAT repeat protein
MQGKAVQPLIDGLRDPQTSRWAAAALAGWGKAPIRALVRALGDDSPAVRRQVAEVLGNKRAKEALPALKRLLEDPDPSVKNAAQDSIQRIERGEEKPSGEGGVAAHRL